MARKRDSGVPEKAAGVELGADWRGDAMILASAVCWGWYSAGTARLVVRYGSLSVTYWLLIVGTVMTSQFAGATIPFSAGGWPALRGAAAGGHPFRWRSSTMCPEIACVAPPRACPPQEH